MATVYLLVGFVGSGKTTYAQRIEQQTGAVRFTLDEWMLPLFGETSSLEDLTRRTQLLQSRFRDLAARFVRAGVDVIFDSGFWSREERRAARAWAESITPDVRMVHFAVDMDRCLERVLARPATADRNAYAIDAHMFYGMARRYEPPTEDERFEVTIRE